MVKLYLFIFWGLAYLAFCLQSVFCLHCIATSARLESHRNKLMRSHDACRLERCRFRSSIAGYVIQFPQYLLSRDLHNLTDCLLRLSCSTLISEAQVEFSYAVLIGAASVVLFTSQPSTWDLQPQKPPTFIQSVAAVWQWLLALLFGVLFAILAFVAS